jgi:hypothetical protein
MYVKTRSHGRQRVGFYGCASVHHRGRTVCENSLDVPMLRADSAIMEAIQGEV